MDYRIIKINNTHPEWWKNANAANVDIFPWPAPCEDDFRPTTSARMALCDDSLYVYMETNETKTRAEEKGFSGLVYTDSCMELFLMPDPGNSAQYLNWEFNPAGAMYLSIGTHRFDRHDVRDDDYRELFKVKTVKHNNGWNLEYRVSLVFLRCWFPHLEFKQGHVMRGNFYKCGDKTAKPHFSCWSPIDLSKPDFHCPGFFGNLIFC